MLKMRSTDVHAEPTLGNALRAVADAQMPARFYQILQVALPGAYQLWGLGWHRSAAMCLAVSAFGVWALCEQQRTTLEPPTRAAMVIVGVRRLAGTVAAVAVGGLAVQAFIGLMGIVFRCPGCAG